MMPEKKLTSSSSKKGFKHFVRSCVKGKRKEDRDEGKRKLFSLGSQQYLTFIRREHVFVNIMVLEFDVSYVLIYCFSNVLYRFYEKYIRRISLRKKMIQYFKLPYKQVQDFLQYAYCHSTPKMRNGTLTFPSL